MARIRTVKPEFFTSDDTCRLSPFARLMFIGCWCEADREGRLEWKPRTLRRKYLPEDDCDGEAVGQELVDHGLIVLYGQGLAVVPKFLKHQVINAHEAKSKLPDPPACIEVHVRADALPEMPVGKGREGKGIEGKGKKESEVALTRSPRTGSRLAEDWQPSPEDRAFAGDFDIDVEATASVFRDYWHGIAGAKGRKADWAATWRNWIRREVESRKQRPSVLTKSNGSNGSAPHVPNGGPPWEAILSKYKRGGFWSPMWGERPEDIPEGRTPTQIPPAALAAWRASA